MVRGEPLSQAAPDSSPTEGSLWRNRSLCGDCQSLPSIGEVAMRSIDGEVFSTAAHGHAVLHTTSQSASQPAPLLGEPLAKPFTLRGLPKPPLLGATATTAASGGNRESLLGPRPAGCKRQRSRRWEPQPGQCHRVSDDGEVGLRQSLSFVGKSGSLHRFLYLFVEVYGILILHPVPAH
mgnify:CR=1 FL=1